MSSHLNFGVRSPHDCAKGRRKVLRIKSSLTLTQIYANTFNLLDPLPTGRAENIFFSVRRKSSWIPRIIYNEGVINKSWNNFCPLLILFFGLTVKLFYNLIAKMNATTEVWVSLGKVYIVFSAQQVLISLAFWF